MFSGGIKWEHWPEISQTHCSKVFKDYCGHNVAGKCLTKVRTLIEGKTSSEGIIVRQNEALQ